MYCCYVVFSEWSSVFLKAPVRTGMAAARMFVDAHIHTRPAETAHHSVGQAHVLRQAWGSHEAHRG